MNRAEFMRELERLLQNIPEAERREALDYYNGYFDDAGAENEEQVIRELGSPGKVAAIIRADLEGNGGEYGEYTERGYEDTRTRKAAQVPGQYGSAGKGDHARRRYSRGTVILIVILIVCASPILLGVGGGILGILLGIAGALLGLAAGILGGIIGFLLGGAALVGASIAECFASPAIGLLGIGIGFFMMAVGMLLLLLLVWLAGRALPALFRALSDAARKAAGRVRGEKKGGESV